MGHFALIVKGLYYGLVFYIVLTIMEWFLPGTLATETGYSVLGAVSIFGLMVLESFFSFGEGS